MDNNKLENAVHKLTERTEVLHETIERIAMRLHEDYPK